MRLETERLVLSSWEERDREPLIALQTDPTVRRFYPDVPTPARVSENLDAAIEKTRLNGFHFGSARLRADDRFVGLIGIGVVPDAQREAIPGHPRVEIGWVFAEEFWGQGLAPEGARAWLGYAWSIGLPEIVAFTAAINTPSQPVLVTICMRSVPFSVMGLPKVPA